MYTFEPVLNGRTIQIHSNTYWTCDSDSNFKLSKNSGFGNDEIEIIVPETILNVYGVVTFSYGDERCKYPDITIRFANSCYINTVRVLKNVMEKMLLHICLLPQGNHLPLK